MVKGILCPIKFLGSPQNFFGYLKLILDYIKILWGTSRFLMKPKILWSFKNFYGALKMFGNTPKLFGVARKGSR